MEILGEFQANLRQHILSPSRDKLKLDSNVTCSVSLAVSRCPKSEHTALKTTEFSKSNAQESDRH